MVNWVCSKYNLLLKKQFAVYSLGKKILSLIILTEHEYYAAGWRKILFKMLVKGWIKAVWFSLPFENLHLIASFVLSFFFFLLPFSFSFCTAVEDFPKESFLRHITSLFFSIISIPDLLAALQNILYSLFTLERFWEEVINWKVKDYIV